MLVRRLVLVAVMATGTVAAGVASTPAATAAGTKCVALVVDARNVGGAVQSSCVTVSTSASGADVLVKGGHHVTFDPRYGDNFVCAIDGRPAGGCHANDNTHFWVYYHRAPGSGSWRESAEGAGTYRPANRSTEGWVYDDGSSSAPQPASVPYASICRTKPSPASSPTPSAAPPRTPTVTATATVTPDRAPAASAATATKSPRHPARARPRPPTATPTSSTPTAATPHPSPAAANAPPAAHRSGFPTGLVAALAAVAAVGAAAVVRNRRSRE